MSSSSSAETRVGLNALRQQFLELPLPETALAPGSFCACITGPAWVRLLAPLALACLGFHGWMGKRIAADGAGMNLARRNGRVVAFAPMQLQLETSRLDGKPAWVLRYPATARFPQPLMVDEFRPLDANRLLGLSFTNLPGLRRLPLPFLLERCSEDALR